MKKTLIAIAVLFSMNLMAQTASEPVMPVYLLREFMKVEPGKDADYLKTERLWQKVHQRRVAEGQIEGWALYRSVLPSGTNAQYDYMTVTTTKDGNQMEQSNSMDWDYITKGMTTEELALANDTEKTRKIVARALYMLTERTQNGGKYIELTTLRANAGQGGKLAEFEKMMKPVFEEIAKSGTIAGWRFGEILYPITPQSGTSYRVITTNTMEDMLTWNDKSLQKSFKKVYPAKDYNATMKAIRDIITIQTVQLLERVYQTERR